MREKIARAMCPKKDPELNCDDCVQELVCKPRIDALLALFTASQAELKEESSARLDILQFMTDWVENHICEITAMREALMAASTQICVCCSQIKRPAKGSKRCKGDTEERKTCPLFVQEMIDTALGGK